MSLRGVFSCQLQQPSFAKAILSCPLQTRAGRDHESEPQEQGELSVRCHPQGGQGDLESSETDENEHGQGETPSPKVLEEATAKESRSPGQLCDAMTRSVSWDKREFLAE